MTLSTEPMPRRFAFYAALAGRVVDAYGVDADQGDLEEFTKTAVARTGTAYDPETIRKAVDAALCARRRAARRRS